MFERRLSSRISFLQQGNLPSVTWAGKNHTRIVWSVVPSISILTKQSNSFALFKTVVYQCCTVLHGRSHIKPDSNSWCKNPMLISIRNIYIDSFLGSSVSIKGHSTYSLQKHFSWLFCLKCSVQWNQCFCKNFNSCIFFFQIILPDIIKETILQ